MPLATSYYSCARANPDAIDSPQLSMIVALLVMLQLGGAPIWIGPDNKVVAVTEMTLSEAFSTGLKRTEETRKKDPSSTVQVTDLFSEFYRHKRIGPYLKFFEESDVRVQTSNQNQVRFVYVELDREQLSSRGYRGFLRGDKLVLVFTTKSVVSDEITSFKVTLLNPNTL